MRWARWALAFALASCTTRAFAQTGAAELSAPQQAVHVDATTLAALGTPDRATVAPFTVSAKLESGVGQGSFVADPYARNPYVAWGASFVPAYYPIPALTLSVFMKLAQEVTNSDFDSERQQFLFYDVQLRARYAAGTIPVLDIDAFVEGRLYLPTSKVAEYEGLMLGALGRVALIRAFGPLVIGYSGLFRKNFHRSEHPSIDARGVLPSAYARPNGAEDLTGTSVAIGANNVSFSFLNALFMSYVPLPNLAFSLSYGVSHAFTYTRYERDEFSGEGARAGRGQRDVAFGGFDIWYRLSQRFAFSAGVSTSAAPKTEDNRSFRFPFYDFESPGSNLTMFYLDMTVTEFLGG